MFFTSILVELELVVVLVLLLSFFRFLLVYQTQIEHELYFELLLARFKDSRCRSCQILVCLPPYVLLVLVGLTLRRQRVTACSWSKTLTPRCLVLRRRVIRVNRHIFLFDILAESLPSHHELLLALLVDLLLQTSEGFLQEIRRAFFPIQSCSLVQFFTLLHWAGHLVEG